MAAVRFALIQTFLLLRRKSAHYYEQQSQVFIKENAGPTHETEA